MRTAIIVVICAILAFAGVASADISVNWSGGGGAYNNGGSWASGPYPDYTGLRQLIWSLTNPSSHNAQLVTPNYLDVGEYLLFTYSAGSEDYSQWSVINSGIHSNQDVGGNNITNGYVFSRIFQDPTPSMGEWYYQSAALGPNLTAFDGGNPLSALELSATPESPVELDRTFEAVVPEPATLAFMGLGVLLMIVRRRFARA